MPDPSVCMESLQPQIIYDPESPSYELDTRSRARRIDVQLITTSRTAHRSTFRYGRPGAPPHLHREASELFYVLGP